MPVDRALKGALSSTATAARSPCLTLLLLGSIEWPRRLHPCQPEIHPPILNDRAAVHDHEDAGGARPGGSNLVDHPELHPDAPRPSRIAPSTTGATNSLRRNTSTISSGAASSSVATTARPWIVSPRWLGLIGVTS